MHRFVPPVSVHMCDVSTDPPIYLKTAIEERAAGGTIIPIIISTDKTQLTLFRNRSAYPIYMTIGNIPKDIRRKTSHHAYVLLGYLPSARLSHIKSDTIRRLAAANIFHACMRRVLAPLREAGIEGQLMASGDGVVRRCHPLFAVFVGDYPEQCLVACCKNGECPKCHVDPNNLGSFVQSTRRDISKVLEALESVDWGPEESRYRDYTEACQNAGIKPILNPFWEDLPYTDVFQSITPDALHQLYQGVVKHVITWIKAAYGEDEIDARFRRLPPNHNLRHFAQGISHLARVSGQEHKDICRGLLGVIHDLPLPGGQSPVRLIRSVCSLLDFVYLAQFPSHTGNAHGDIVEGTLSEMQDALKTFHDNKAIFFDLGIRADFNLPKLHSLLHYVRSITYFGTLDNYDTSYSERLHIDYAKDAWRATNHKDEYIQMTRWMERQEQIYHHGRFVHWRLAGEPSILDLQPPKPTRQFRYHIARFPNHKAVRFESLARNYGAIDFRVALSHYIIRLLHPTLSLRQVKNIAQTFHLPFNSVPLFNKIKFWQPDAQGRGDAAETLDTIHVRAGYTNTVGRPVPGRFDTALVKLDNREEFGVAGMHLIG